MLSRVYFSRIPNRHQNDDDVFTRSGGSTSMLIWDRESVRGDSANR
ncbi:hypothetical protein RSSM_03751 [Rhodopirellula sallentina SM41]|uniref:Uncharacterized protein n=1 Tax=Rhodopirellula sallentina SM41 TaxID=1263870 RepID=M5U034_9BACT|nr:hypothetical protein RSSM_03751 [Rhodopirellula sallentina SM41]